MEPKRSFPLNRRSTITTPIPDAISFETCSNMLEEVIALNRNDMKQMRKVMNDMFLDELEHLLQRVNYLRNAIYEIKYERSDKGIAARLKRKGIPR